MFNISLISNGCWYDWSISTINDHICTVQRTAYNVSVRGLNKNKSYTQTLIPVSPSVFLINCVFGVLDIWLDTRQAVIGAETSNGSKGCFHKNFAPNFPAHMMFIVQVDHLSLFCRSEGVYHCRTEVMGLKQIVGAGGVQKLPMTETGQWPSSISSYFQN